MLFFLKSGFNLATQNCNSASGFLTYFNFSSHQSIILKTDPSIDVLAKSSSLYLIPTTSLILVFNPLNVQFLIITSSDL